MNKNIRSIFLFDKTKPFAVVKPFYDTCRHFLFSPRLRFPCENPIAQKRKNRLNRSVFCGLPCANLRTKKFSQNLLIKEAYHKSSVRLKGFLLFSGFNFWFSVKVQYGGEQRISVLRLNDPFAHQSNNNRRPLFGVLKFQVGSPK